MMFNDTCDTLVTLLAVSVLECENFSYGVAKQGFITIMVRYFQLESYMKDRLLWMIDPDNKDKKFAWDSNTLIYPIPDDQLKENLLNALRMEDGYELSKFLLLSHSFHSTIIHEVHLQTFTATILI